MHPRPRAALLLTLLLAPAAHAQIYRIDNRQAIPGTENILLVPGADLSGWNLPSHTLEFANLGFGLDLSNATFAGSNLQNAFFQGSNFTNANFENADLTNSLPNRGALFAGANLRHANLTNCVFDCPLTNTDFTGATIDHGGFANDGYVPVDIVTPSQFYATTTYASGNLNNMLFRGIQLDGWDFTGKSLVNADLRYSTLANARFTNANLTYALFSAAPYTPHADYDLSGAIIRGAFFYKADLSSSQLYATASYQQHDLYGLCLIGMSLVGWDFSHQNLQYASFDRSDLTLANFDFADLRTALSVAWSVPSNASTFNTILPNGTAPTLTLAPASSRTLAPHPLGIKVLNTFSLAGSPGHWTATLDLTTNTLILPTTTASKETDLATLVDQLRSGKLGTGITSSTVAANPNNLTVGLFDNADLNLPSYAGQPLDANSLLVAPTQIGDANLDHNVDLADYDLWYKNVGGQANATSRGDFNLDNQIDLADYDAWYQHVGATFPLTPGGADPSPLTPSSVPEPTSLALLVTTLPLILARRSTRKPA